LLLSMVSSSGIEYSFIKPMTNAGAKYKNNEKPITADIQYSINKITVHKLISTIGKAYIMKSIGRKVW
jgi:hypothetical protein